MGSFMLAMANVYAWYFMAAYFREVALTPCDEPTPAVDALCNLFSVIAAGLCLTNFVLMVQGAL